MQPRSSIVLETALQVLRPLVRLMLRHGVAYPAFAVALKRVFLDAAQQELKSQGMPQTDSAVSLLSGVHRRDVRNLTRLAPSARQQPSGAVGLAAQVVARWLSDPRWLDANDHPKELVKSGESGSFADLVRSVSTDVRSRAVLDELLRLGVATETEDCVRLSADGFAPRQGFEDMALQFQANMHDHMAAASQNLDGQANFLEQSVYTDEITAESVQKLQKVSVQVWRQAFKTMMREIEARYQNDQTQATPEQRQQRVRFGVYFYTSEVHDDDASR